MAETDPIILDFREYHENGKLSYLISFAEGKRDTVDLVKFFKLTSSLKLTNLVAFNPSNQLTRYEIPQIIEVFV